MQDRLTVLEPKQAIALAKAYVADLFGDEDVTSIRLEELRFDDEHEQWRVTVGFERLPPPLVVNGLSLELGQPAREYKVVAIRDDTARVVSVTNWTAS